MEEKKQIKKESFLASIKEKILLGDGAMGTMLQDMGITACPDSINIEKEQVQKVIGIHLGYLQAGSDIIQTNTFGSNPVKLKSCKLDSNLEEINKNAVGNVKEAINRYRKEGNNRKIFIAGDIGPLGKLLEPAGDIAYSQATEFFSKQIEALVEAGIDLILIETIMDINEASAAIEAAKALDRTLPIACTLTFGENAVTMMGTKASDAVKVLQEKGADVVGANCSLGSKLMLKIVKEMREADPKAKLMFQPNAGMPVLENGKTTYKESADIMAENIKKYLKYKPSIIGACCGSTPEHIKKLASLISPR